MQANRVQAFDANAYVQKQQEQINNLYNSQREAQLAQLKAQRDKAVGEVNHQKQKVAPQYQGLRNQTDTVNHQNVQRLRETMAASGLTRSGENITAMVAQNNARQNSLNSLNLQEQDTMNDFEHRITQLNDPSEQNALIMALEAERARALYEGGLRAEELGYSRNRDIEMDNRYYDERDYSRGRDTVADQRYSQEWQNQLAQQKLEEQWRQREWNEMSPAEKAAAELDWEYYKKKQALGGSGGGGSRSSSGGSSGSSKTTSAKTQYQQAKSSSSKTPADKYYATQENIMKGSVVRKNPVIPVPSIGSNAALSNYDRLQMIKQQYGIR